MPKEHPSYSGFAPFTAGIDWSAGLNSRTSTGQSQLLQQLGWYLRLDYKQIVEEPLPEAFEPLLRHLNCKKTPLEE